MLNPYIGKHLVADLLYKKLYKIILNKKLT